MKTSLKKLSITLALVLAALALVLFAVVSYEESRMTPGLKITERTLDISATTKNTDSPDTPNSLLEKQKDEVINGTFKNWKTYQNKEVGISFKYPDIFKRVDVRVSKGSTGYQFVGVLEFYPNYGITFGGVSKDYSASKGGSIVNTYGFEKRGDVHVAKFVWGDSFIVPSELWEVNNGKDKAIVVRNTEIDYILPNSAVTTFVNIPKSIFPGMVFNIIPSVAQGQVDEKDVEILHQIVSSIVFL